MKVKHWINNFKSLDKDQQLVVAKAMIDEIQGNREILDGDRINDFFDSLIKSTDTKQELKKLQSVITRFQNLSLERQDEVRETIISEINKQCKNQEQEEKEKICAIEGHIFSGEWKYNSWTRDEEGYLDHQRVCLPVKYEEWTKVCDRCGYKDVRNHEPEELIKRRKEQERQEKIKKLEKELYDLRNQQPND